MKNFQIILIAFFIVAFSNNFTATAQNENILSYQETVAGLTYSWSAAFNAVSYNIELEHQGTAQKYSQETANTTATFSNLPSGNYDIVVKATKSDGSTSIVITDESAL